MGVFDAPDPESDVRFLLTVTNTEIQYPYSTQKFAYFKKLIMQSAFLLFILLPLKKEKKEKTSEKIFCEEKGVFGLLTLCHA